MRVNLTMCPENGKVCFVPETGKYGVDPKIYSMAKTFVDKFEFNYYTEMYEDTRNYQLNIAKICEISMWLLNYLNSTDQYGFLKDGSIINVDVIK